MALLWRRIAARDWYSGKQLVFCVIALLGTFALFIMPTSAAPRCSRGDLVDLPGFGGNYNKNLKENPGKLKAYYYKPDDLPSNAPLVVALHGCGQRACDYDDETGWIALAQRYKFALLFPEQQQVDLLHLNPLGPSGNPGYCFSWWLTSEADRHGEPESIMNMTKHMVNMFKLDPQRIYITGLSGGGAMTVTMLAAYRGCFAGGAPMAGVPANCAEGVWPHTVSAECMCIDIRDLRQDVLGSLGLFAADYEQKHEQCMRMEEPVPGRTAAWWGDRVREIADNAESTRWPRISIWQGSNDNMVAPINLKRLMLQWTDVHGLNPAAGKTVQEPQPDASPYDIQHTTYADASGRVQVETYLIESKDPVQEAPATGHASAIDPDATDWKCGCSSIDCACETRGICDDNKLKYIQDANICSSLRVAQFWGLDQPATSPSGRRCEALRD